MRLRFITQGKLLGISELISQPIRTTPHGVIGLIHMRVSLYTLLAIALVGTTRYHMLVSAICSKVH
jgi:hypothetical protein